MNFEGFVNRVLDQIKEYLPESFQDAEFVVRQHEKLNNQYAAYSMAETIWTSGTKGRESNQNLSTGTV